MANIHADLIDQYCEDCKETDRPWERWQLQLEYNNGWSSCVDPPKWLQNHKYRRKPKTININGFEVPEPVRTPLKRGQIYFIPMASYAHYYAGYAWNDCENDKYLLERGLIHLNVESAILHAKASLSFTSVKNYD